jgi:hypothetical protein
VKTEKRAYAIFPKWQKWDFVPKCIILVKSLHQKLNNGLPGISHLAPKCEGGQATKNAYASPITRRVCYEPRREMRQIRSLTTKGPCNPWSRNATRGDDWPGDRVKCVRQLQHAPGLSKQGLRVAPSGGIVLRDGPLSENSIPTNEIVIQAKGPDGRWQNIRRLCRWQPAGLKSSESGFAVELDRHGAQSATFANEQGWVHGFENACTVVVLDAHHPTVAAFFQHQGVGTCVIPRQQNRFDLAWTDFLAQSLQLMNFE